MATNIHGLDTRYFKQKLESIIRDVSCYTPGEMTRELSRLVDVAKHQESELTPAPSEE